MLDDLVAEVRRRPGHRLGLVAFAGRPLLICPLTHDYDHFAEAVATLESLPGGPELAPPPDEKSGTRIGLGLHEALLALDERSLGAADLLLRAQVQARMKAEGLDERSLGAADLLLLSDGDDPERDDEWAYGAQECQDAGFAVHVVGIGDPDRDYAVPGRDGASTRLQEGPLRDIARRTGGEYFPARTRPFGLGGAYLALDRQPPAARGERRRPAGLPATLALVPAAGPAAARRRPRPARRRRPPCPAPAGPAAGSPPGRTERHEAPARRRDGDRRPGPAAGRRRPGGGHRRAAGRQGHAAFDRGDYAAAADLFDRALKRAPDPAPAAFALAATKYRLAVEGPATTRLQTVCDGGGALPGVHRPAGAAAGGGAVWRGQLPAGARRAALPRRRRLRGRRPDLLPPWPWPTAASATRWRRTPVTTSSAGACWSLQTRLDGQPGRQAAAAGRLHGKKEEPKKNEPKKEEKKPPQDKGGDGQAGQRVEKGRRRATGRTRG